MRRERVHALPISVLSMGDAVNEYDTLGVVDPIQDSIGALADSILIGSPAELLDALRARVIRERIDSFRNSQIIGSRDAP